MEIVLSKEELLFHQENFRTPRNELNIFYELMGKNQVGVHEIYNPGFNLQMVKVRKEAKLTHAKYGTSK